MEAAKRRNWMLAAAGVALVLAVGGFLLTRKGGNAGPTRFETTAADRGRVVARVTATGTLSALVTVQVGSQVSGRVAELAADFNSQVKKGDLLARIDPQLFEANREQARANFVAAQANLTKAKVQAEEAQRQAERSHNLLERKLIAQAEYDTARANADAARAQVEASGGSLQQARASLNQAEVNLQYTRILSPINGVVISRSVELGQTVAASLQAPTLFVLAEDLRKMQVDTSVSEADIGKLKDGMPAYFTVDAYPSERFAGKLRQIRNAPTTVQNVVTYNAIIDVENPELKLKPGMTANVTFIYANQEDVLRVPNAALRFRPPPELLGRAGGGGGGGGPGAAGRRGGPGGGTGGSGGGRRGGMGGELDPPDKRTVWVLRDGQPVPMPVRVGASDGSVTEVVSGELKEGDSVITEAVQAEGAPRNTGLPGMGGPGGGGGGMRRVF